MTRAAKRDTAERITQLRGIYFRPRTQRAVAGVMEIFDGALIVSYREYGLPTEDTVEIARLVPPLSGQRAEAAFTSGGYFTAHSGDPLAIHKLVARRRIFQTLRYHIERLPPLAFLFLACTIALLGSFIAIGVPGAQDRLARELTYEDRALLGQAMMRAIDYGIAEPDETGLSLALQARLAEDFHLLARETGSDGSAVLYLRDFGPEGPYVLTGPGGHFILNDALTELFERYFEEPLARHAMAGLIARELAHDELRHIDHHLIGSALVGVVALAALGDSSFLVGQLAALGNALFVPQFSEAEERAADLRAVELLTYTGFDPLSVGYALAALATECSANCDNAYLETYPRIGERIAAICAVAPLEGRLNPNLCPNDDPQHTEPPNTTPLDSTGGQPAPASS